MKINELKKEINYYSVLYKANQYKYNHLFIFLKKLNKLLCGVENVGILIKGYEYLKNKYSSLYNDYKKRYPEFENFYNNYKTKLQKA
jgi:hypothetical protein